MAQRGEIARPRRVVLHEQAVDLELAQERLGDRLVSALGTPRAAHVAAAHVDAGPRALGPVLDAGVDYLRLEARQRLRILADAPVAVVKLRNTGLLL